MKHQPLSLLGCLSINEDPMKSARSCLTNVSLFNHHEARDNAGPKEKRIH